MKRYRFRLDPALRVRRTQEDLARAALLAATTAAVLQEREVERQTAAYTAALTAHGIRPCADFLFEQAHRAALGASVLRQRELLAAARADVDAARAAWSDAAARVGALERLDERARAEHRLQSDREDQLTSDELVTARHGRQQS